MQCVKLVFPLGMCCVLCLCCARLPRLQAAEEALKAKLSKKRPPASAESESPKGKKLKKETEKVIVNGRRQRHTTHASLW